jgi:hypothetical protein
MTQDERRFIVLVKEGKPRWDLFGVPESRIPWCRMQASARPNDTCHNTERRCENSGLPWRTAQFHREIYNLMDFPLAQAEVPTSQLVSYHQEGSGSSRIEGGFFTRGSNRSAC